MKLKKIPWYKVGIGVFVLLAAILGLTYMREINDQDSNRQQLLELRSSRALQTEEKMITQLNDLRTKISTAESQTGSIKTELSQPAESGGTLDTLYTIAEKKRVRIESVAVGQVRPGTLGTVRFDVLSVGLEVAGMGENVSAFIFELGRAFPTGEVASVKIEGPDGFRANTTAAATIDLRIYSYKGE